MADLLTQTFKEAFEEFIDRERLNIINGVSERNLCGRLSIYLERAAHKAGMAGYYADVDYNRKQNGRVKTILDDSMEVIVIFADLILHSRGEIVKRDNLIAVEMKKAERPEEEKERDRTRLRAMTKASYDDVWSYDGKTHPEHVCGYELGLFVELDAKTTTYKIQEFRRGKCVDEYTGAF